MKKSKTRFYATVVVHVYLDAKDIKSATDTLSKKMSKTLDAVKGVDVDQIQIDYVTEL